MNQTSLQLLHIAAHIDTIESKILPALRKGYYVVLDRFWWSTWVYGIVSGADQRSLKAMIELEGIHWENTCPAICFLVERRTPLDGKLTSPWNRLIEEYAKLASREGYHYPVRCISNESTVAESLAEVVRHAGLNTQFSGQTRTNLSLQQNSQMPLPFDPRGTIPPAPFSFSKLAPMKTTIVYDTYWRFAAERQEIFFRRFFGGPLPWTSDRILQKYKFTNAYRASDRVSQFLIRHVIYEGDQSPDEVVFRTLLFKVFNRIETWEMLTNKLGVVSLADYSVERYDAILSRAAAEGTSIYSAAYIMPSGGLSSASRKKHRMHLELIERMIRDELPDRLANAPCMRKVFELLRSYPTIGDFLAYQYTTDLNYSTLTNFSESEFVVPGPGARDGIRKCFSDLGGLNETEIIKAVADHQQVEFERLGLNFRSLWGRPLQLIDCQNLFCEVDKYARVNHPEVAGITGRTRIKQKYHMTSEPISYWYPPKWRLNDRITPGGDYVPSI